MQQAHQQIVRLGPTVVRMNPQPTQRIVSDGHLLTKKLQLKV